MNFGFHYRNGFYWKRLDDGSVRLTKTCSYRSKYPDFEGEPVQDEVADWTLTIDPSSWASIVASVSARGETGKTYRAALAAHSSAASA